VKRREDAMTNESDVDMNEAMQLTKHMHAMQAPGGWDPTDIYVWMGSKCTKWRH
jgi:hypothetical protein